MWLTQTLRADFARGPRPLDRVSLVVFRLNQAAHRSRWRPLFAPLARGLDVLWLQIVVGAELPARIECGPGLRLPHAGRGVIVHPNARIGAGVTLYHRVTLGVSGPDPMNVPTIRDGAYLGTGATVIGRVTVGAGAKIGAGAVVTTDVPDERTAVGVPARVL